MIARYVETIAMLKSYKQHMPSRLDAGDTSSISLEDSVTTTPIFFPKMLFKNIETVSTFRVRIIHTLALGVSDDPLDTGDYISVIYDETLDPDDFDSFELPTTIDNNLDEYTIEITNNGISESIIQCWFEGMVDTALVLVNPPDVVI